MENNVAKVLRIIAIVEIVAGIILGLILGNTNELYGSSLDFMVFLMWSALGFFSGMIFIGFAEIIDLLHRINLKLGKSSIEISENESNGNGEKLETTSPTKKKYDIYKSIVSDKKEM